MLFLPARMLRAGIVLPASVCLTVCVSVCLCAVRTNSRKLLIRNWCNLVGICLMVNARSNWKLVTFDESYIRIFPAQAILLEWLYLATSFLVRWYIFRISRSGSVSRSSAQGQGHRSAKAVACYSKTTGWKPLRLDRNICYDNARSNSKLLTFWPWPLTLRHNFHIFSNSSFECLKLRASFSVWWYIFRISKSPASFEVTGLISRSRLENSGSLCCPRTQYNLRFIDLFPQ